MQKIRPNLWCNNNAKESANFYTTVFNKAKIASTTFYPNSKEEGLADFQLDMAGKELTVELSVDGYNFVLINAGPEFKPNSSISFMVNFDPSHNPGASEYLDKVWTKLTVEGEVLMPLDTYPFSKKYGWVRDKYGITWQLILTDPEEEPRPFIIPSMMFSGDNTNKAEEAISFYLSIFKNSKLGLVARYPEKTGPANKDSIMFADFKLNNEWLIAMDSGVEQNNPFNEAISLEVICEDQQEIDHYWEKLSNSPESEQCGWLKDKYGVSWQIVPKNMDELMKKPNAYGKIMEMKKIIINDF